MAIPYLSGLTVDSYPSACKVCCLRPLYLGPGEFAWIASVEDNPSLPDPIPSTTSHIEEVHSKTRPKDIIVAAAASIPTSTVNVEDIAIAIVVDDLVIHNAVGEGLVIPFGPMISDDLLVVADIDSFDDIRTFLADFGGVVQPARAMLVDLVVEAASDDVLEEVVVWLFQSDHCLLSWCMLQPQLPRPVIVSCRSLLFLNLKLTPSSNKARPDLLVARLPKRSGLISKGVQI
ncbi:hypothetical protein V6N13_130690 [Hibiscus sabdariffa]|uniref:Uncharacterized protein n=2 Tax=Hibiscus sabdariffa TaxID=183260 RepID=A0ABR2BMZ5_9ROSI